MMEEKSAATSPLFSLLFLSLVLIQESLCFEFDIVMIWLAVRHLNNHANAEAAATPRNMLQRLEKRRKWLVFVMAAVTQTVVRLSGGSKASADNPPSVLGTVCHINNSNNDPAGAATVYTLACLLLAVLSSHHIGICSQMVESGAFVHMLLSSGCASTAARVAAVPQVHSTRGVRLPTRCGIAWRECGADIGRRDTVSRDRF